MLINYIKHRFWNYYRDRWLYNNPIREKVGRAQFFHNAFAALSFNGIEGDYAEFGSHTGKTFALAYHASRRYEYDRTLWAFDSFQGLPSITGKSDEHPVWREGKFATSLDQFHKICARADIPRRAYKCIAGFYQDTLPALETTDELSSIALAYIDCDMYSSTKAVLEFLKPRLKHGMIIGFDDFFCYSASQIAGERRAMEEAFATDSQWHLLPYMQFSWGGMSFVVEDKRISQALVL